MQKNPKNFAIWTALNSGVELFSESPGYWGDTKRNEKQTEQMFAFCKKHGVETLGSWSLYRDSDMMAKIKEIGIDWDKCPIPESDRASQFNGTEADSTWKEIVVGKLVLMDGEVIDYYAECSLNIDQFKAMQAFFDA